MFHFYKLKVKIETFYARKVSRKPRFLFKDMIMDWVHCNNCFLLPDREKCFFLTSCGHIFCRDCERECAHDVCKLCGNQCTSIPLSSSMKPDVQVYFTDPDELLKAKLKEVQKISAFQRNHRARLMTYYRKELNKYRQMKDVFKKVLNNLKELESERKHLTKENSSLKKIIQMSGLPKSLTPLLSGGSNSNYGNRKGQSLTSPQNDSTPSTSHLNPVFSQFLSKLDGSANVSSSDRVSVFSPPVNGKLGSIHGTPSPSSVMRKLHLSSAHLSDSGKYRNEDKVVTPTCSQESSDGFNLKTGSATSSPADVWSGLKDSRNMGYQFKKDPRKVIVHPYSPNE